MTHCCNYPATINYRIIFSISFVSFVPHLWFGLDTVIVFQGPPCLLDVQKDFPRPNDLQPLYLRPETNQFWLPNERGQLEIPRGATIELQCTKSFANSTRRSDNRKNRNNSNSNANDNGNGNSNTNTTTRSFANIFQIAKNTRTIRPRCLQDKSFLWQGEKYEFRQFICEKSTRYTVEQLHEKCPAMTDGSGSPVAEMFRVGFNISSSRFVETMRICYDDAQLRTLYVRHVLVPASVHFQRSVKRLNFSRAGYFSGFNMNHLYSHHNQQQQASVALQGAPHGHLFDNNTLFLARGHLAAKADFVYASQQRATFNFFNVAPQWQAFNGGQWAALEDEVRKYVTKTKRTVDCYTGTWGIMQLPHANLTPPADFYLAQDANNNGLLPVPLLYYRLLVDPLRGHGIALVGVNNPHATLNEIISRYVICDDIREQIAWLRWMKNKNLKKGYLYACQVPDFVRAIGHLPRHLVNVTGILV